MPQGKPKPSEIALEAKRKYLPSLEASEQWQSYMCGSCLIKDTAEVPVNDDGRKYGRPRVTVEDGDPVNTVIGARAYGSMALVNTANERKPGGDWESGFTAAEECLARRSTLTHALKHSYQGGGGKSGFYPIPQRGAIYSPHVGKVSHNHLTGIYAHVFAAVVFREGEKGGYRPYEEYQDISVISVAPIRGPRLDVSGSDYSFPEERELMESKMKAILRTAAWAKVPRLCIAAFGIGPVFKNPARVTALMWKQLLFHDQEFYGAFEDIVFAIDTSSSSASKTGQEDLDAYRDVFHPSNVIPSQYRQSHFTYD